MDEEFFRPPTLRSRSGFLRRCLEIRMMIWAFHSRWREQVVKKFLKIKSIGPLFLEIVIFFKITKKLTKFEISKKWIFRFFWHISFRNRSKNGKKQKIFSASGQLAERSPAVLYSRMRLAEGYFLPKFRLKWIRNFSGRSRCGPCAVPLRFPPASSRTFLAAEI